MGQTKQVIPLNKAAEGRRTASPWPDLQRVDREALPFQPDPLIIEARPYPPLARSTLYIVVAIMICGIVWASLSRIERIVIAHGKIITVDPVMIVQPLEIGVIRTINARVGQVVKAGEMLATLDPTFTESEQTSSRERLNSLIAESQRLQAELADQDFPNASSSLDEVNGKLQETIYARRKAEHIAATAAYSAQIANLEAQIVTNESAQAGMQDRLRLLGEIEGVRKELWDKKLGSLLAYDQARLEKLNLADQLRERLNQRRELSEKLAGVRQDMEKYVNNWKREGGEKLTDILRQASELRTKVTVAERRGNLIVLRSPADGVVLEIAQRSIGSVVKEAETLFSLVPLNGKNEVEAEVESIDVAWLRVGDPVRVKLDSLQYQRYGTLNGSLRTVTEASFAPERQNNNQGARSEVRSAYFRARIALESSQLHNVPADFHLIPGMTTTAEIIIGKRSIISYILDPVVNVFNESLREP
jgi:HlyD family secretion protein